MTPHFLFSENRHVGATFIAITFPRSRRSADKLNLMLNGFNCDLSACRQGQGLKSEGLNFSLKLVIMTVANTFCQITLTERLAQVCRHYKWIGNALECLVIAAKSNFGILGWTLTHLKLSYWKKLAFPTSTTGFLLPPLGILLPPLGNPTSTTRFWKFADS